MSVKSRKNKSTIPKAKVHKGTGQAYVNVHGVRMYLGKAGTPEALRRYSLLVAELTAGGGEMPVPKAEITVSEVMARFLKHAEAYYKRSDGKKSKTVSGFASPIRVVRELFGDIPAVEFGPLALRACRDRFIERDWNRKTVNKAVVAIRSVFRWSAGAEIIPADIHVRLEAVEPLRRGRCGAREPLPVKPVPMEHIDAVRRFLPKQVNALIDLQLLTAARAGELVGLKTSDLDMGGKVWLAKPADHKTAVHGHDRCIYIGKRGQDIIRLFLVGRAIDKPLFSPAESEQDRRDELTRGRKTPLSCGNVPGSNRKKHPKRVTGEAYTVDSYRRAIHFACDKANVPRWSVHRLRHNAATSLRKEFGIEAARLICGHKSPGITALYAEADQTKALEIIAKVG